MEADTWSRWSASSECHQSALQSRFGVCLGLEEMEGGEDDSRPEFACPFCAEDFDIVGLCCHFDDAHPVEAKNGVCPVCAARVGMDMVGHITTEHENIFKIQHRRRLCKGSSGSQSTLSLLRKGPCEGNMQSLYGFAPSNAAPDPLLSLFVINLPAVDPSKDVRPEMMDQGSMINKISDEKSVESLGSSPPDEDEEENARRSEFVRQLMLSTIFDDT